VRGGNVNPKNPHRISAYLRHAAGWSSKVTNMAPGANISLVAGKNEFALLRRNKTQYFIVERMQKRIDESCQKPITSCFSYLRRGLVVGRFVGRPVAQFSALGPPEFSQIWSGRRESNPRMQLGKLPFYH
jgi:hypothetical protein